MYFLVLGGGGEWSKKFIFESLGRLTLVSEFEPLSLLSTYIKNYLVDLYVLKFAKLDPSTPKMQYKISL